MKEASGELSMTAVAVVAIAAIGVVFTTLIWPTIKSTITRNAKCSQTISCVDIGEGKASCTVCSDDECKNTENVVCPTK